MGSVACIVAAVAMIAAALALTGGDDDATTAAGIDPLAAPQSDVEGEGTETSSSAEPGQITPPSTLAVVPLASTTTVAPVTTTTLATTTAAPTTLATTTTVATTATTATTVAADATTTMAAGTDTSMTDASDATTSTTVAGSTESSVAETTETTAEATTTTVADETTPSSDAATSTTVAAPAASSTLNDIEREIARLTNELRTNPNGPLKRQGAAIDCGGRILVDLSSGQYQSISALTLDQTASLQVARPWSQQMTTTNFEHQARAGIPALQAAGISVRSAGENIAYHNYPDKAMNHFVGWRESDGHFCNMMDPNFTHIGVGEVTKSDGISYATQNFFSTR
jgi:uncharacterized protein YkwD